MGKTKKRNKKMCFYEISPIFGKSILIIQFMRNFTRLFGFFTLLQLSCLPIFAQKMTFGVRGGLNMSAPIPTKLDTSSKGKPLFAPLAGFYATYAFSEKWGLQTDVYYTQKGAEYSQYIADSMTINGTINGFPYSFRTPDTGYVSGKMRLQYIEMPIQLSFKAKKWEVLAGPTFSFLLNSKDIATANLKVGSSLDTVVHLNNSGHFRHFDIGISAAVAYHLTKNLNFALRMSRGFIPLYEKGYFVSQGQKDTDLYATTFFQFTLGWRITH